MAKRTAAQKTAGLSGGEGCQMIYGISYAPSNPNIVYFITDTTRVWKSTDGGTSWQLKSNGFGASGGSSLIVHPTNADIVYVAGMNEGSYAWGSQPSGIVQGIFRTTDGGNNWTLLKSALFERSSRGGVHIAFAGSNMYAAPSNTGILKSTDGGTTWNLLKKSDNANVLDTLRLYNIVTHPTDNTILFVSTSNGLYKIIDSGGSATVTKIGTGLPSGAVYQLQIDPGSPGTSILRPAQTGYICLPMTDLISVQGTTGYQHHWVLGVESSI